MPDIDWGSTLHLLSELGKGSLTTLSIFALTLLFSLPLGLLVSLGRMSRFKIISAIVKLYIRIMRGTPLILQIVFVYFVPYDLFPNAKLNFDRFLAVIIAFVLNYAAYFAEIYRGGIQSIPKGQYEASEVLGFTRVQTFFRIIFPQVIKRILPPISNEVITLVKDTALAQTIGIIELYKTASFAAESDFSTAPLFVAGLFYFVMNWIVEKILHLCEKKLDYYR